MTKGKTSKNKKYSLKLRIIGSIIGVCMVLGALQFLQSV